jgi:tetratricopeptide (TPR) repeat protein
LIPYLYKAIATCPQYTLADIDLGIANFEISQYDSAEIYFKRAWELDRNNIRANRNLAILYFTEKKFELSINHYKKLLEFTPNDPDLFHDIGFVYNKMGNADSAKKYEALARQGNPGFKL